MPHHDRRCTGSLGRSPYTCSSTLACSFFRARARCRERARGTGSCCEARSAARRGVRDVLICSGSLRAGGGGGGGWDRDSGFASRRPMRALGPVSNPAITQDTATN